MKNNKSAFQNILTFAEDKGFYIILSLCIVAIAVSGYVLFFTDNSDNSDIPDVIDLPSIDDKAPTDISEPSLPDVKPDNSVTQATPSQANNDTKPPQENTVVSPPQTPPSTPDTTVVSNPISISQPIWVAPLSTEIQRPFSDDVLVFDPTMGDWRTHNGVDFACNEGDSICAIGDGKITAIFTDKMKGNCISITHDGNVVSTYCGLAVNATMKVGMNVTAGQVIAEAGNTMLAEIAQDHHMHLEVTVKGEYVDPIALFND